MRPWSIFAAGPIANGCAIVYNPARRVTGIPEDVVRRDQGLAPRCNRCGARASAQLLGEHGTGHPRSSEPIRLRGIPEPGLFPDHLAIRCEFDDALMAAIDD